MVLDRTKPEVRRFDRPAQISGSAERGDEIGGDPGSDEAGPYPARRFECLCQSAQLEVNPLSRAPLCFMITRRLRASAVGHHRYCHEIA